MNCLELTLYPSLTLALLDEKRVKIFGVKKGVRAGEDVYISGRWYSPWKYINEADRDVRDKVQRLAERFGDCVGISISPGDEDLIFVASFLTQNTSYHTNVLRWTRAMFSKTEDLAEIAKIAPGVGRSYQLRRLPAAVEDYLTLGRPRERAALLRIRGVGPKVADLFLLFTGDTTSAPVDKHYMRIAPKLGLSGRPPESAYCRRYTCDKCPLTHTCLRHLSFTKLGRLAGWVQTLAYLLDKGVLPAENL
ncbi:MAG: DNA lyase [Pyrobaculum arsenaticum]|uniref:HhH-GPD family protein n=2 Tax=Pyrobaculum arsenaticum TaxID=121277 RepID=A4WL98_PYRAR|nr:DNA lyase [Pyrobaculum arsenaticum]ABP51165.1 HhH-GPD family protein [Pyrobaculum arsenaticum DSM 13514]MCY0891599.1 DNA lyase [Pyrobaculum arsenaticum]NYR15111.1 DNA lyase [Pyrobaculum arsenaticum]